MKNDLDLCKEIWEREAAKTIKLLESLPRDGYDFRPHPEGRSDAIGGAERARTVDLLVAIQAFVSRHGSVSESLRCSYRQASAA